MTEIVTTNSTTVDTLKSDLKQASLFAGEWISYVNFLEVLAESWLEEKYAQSSIPKLTKVADAKAEYHNYSTTYLTYRRAIQGYISWHCGHQYQEYFGLKSVNAWRNELVEKAKKPATIDTCLTVLRKFIQWSSVKFQRLRFAPNESDILALIAEVSTRSEIPPNNLIKPMTHWVSRFYDFSSEIENVKRQTVQVADKSRAIPYQRAHIKDISVLNKFFNFMDSAEYKNSKPMFSLRDRTIVSMLFKLGLRTIEVVRLNLEDFDIELSIKKPNGKLAKKKGINILGKGAAEKNTMVVVRDVRKAIIEYLESERSGWEKLDKKEPLFITSAGNRITTTTIRDVFSRAKKLARGHGIDLPKDLSPHGMRHTAGHIAIQSADIARVQRFLRHKSSSTTMTYTAQAVEEKYLQDPVEEML